MTPGKNARPVMQNTFDLITTSTQTRLSRPFGRQFAECDWLATVMIVLAPLIAKKKKLNKPPRSKTHEYCSLRS